MNNEDKRELINKMTRKIAYKVFYNQGDYKFTKAYDKLKAKMMIDYNIHITKRMKEGNKTNIFDVINDEELDLMLKSCKSLCNMYSISSEELYLH